MDLLAPLRYALRQMRRSPGFALTVVLTLGLGIGASTAVFSALDSLLLRPLPYPNAERILSVTDVNRTSAVGNGITSPARFFDLQNRAKTLEKSTFCYLDEPTLVDGPGDPIHLWEAGCSRDFFQVFASRPLLGRVFTAADNQPNSPGVAVLSYKRWQQSFAGDASVIGRTVTIDGAPATLIGVMPPQFDLPRMVDLWRPNHITEAMAAAGRNARYVNIFSLRKPGVSVAQARAEIDSISANIALEHSATDANWRFATNPLRFSLYGSLLQAVRILMLAALAVLLIACVNVANLLLARAVEGQRNVALRRALGADSAALLTQFGAQSAVLCGLGAAAGVLFAAGLLQLIGRLVPPERLLARLNLHVSVRVLAFALLMAALTTLVFGLLPVLLNRRLDLARVLKSGEPRSASPLGRAGNLFIAVQVALSICLLTGAGLFGRSLWNLQRTPLGFIPEHVLTFDVPLPFGTAPEKVLNFYGEVERRTAALPQVAAVGQVTARPLTNFALRSTYDIAGHARTPKMDSVQAEARSVHGGFLEAMGMSLVNGRALKDGDSLPHAPPVLMVNEAFVREYLPNENPIGKHLVGHDGDFEIVGLVRDMRGLDGNLAAPVNAQVYTPANGTWPEMNFVVRSSGDPQLLTNAIREQIRQVDASRAMGDVTTLDVLVQGTLTQPRVNTSLLVLFALLATLLAAVGIYGIIAYNVTQRTREIGVRMALGANRRQVVSLFAFRAGFWAAVGAMAGMAISLALGRVVQSLLYGVAWRDGWTYAGALLLLVLPVSLASYLPARRAAAVPPSEALRAE